MNHQPCNKVARILGMRVDPLNMDSALAIIERQITRNVKGYVCLIGVHGIMEAQRNLDLAAIYEHATLIVPDGMPTVWIGQAQGFTQMQRVTGPDLMLEVFGRPQFAHCTHFLYGGKEGVAEKLRLALMHRFPWVHIAGTYTPPFRVLNADEEDALAHQLNECKPDFLWVGISTPRQEQFMAHLLPRLDTTLMFGVGAAFDFHTGRIKDAPQWIKRAGLQWLHRLAQDPRRLLGRYLRNNSAFLVQIALQFTGLRNYPAPKKAPNSHTQSPALRRKNAIELDI